MDAQPGQSGESISPQRATTPNLILEENYEMLKAMYDFQANYPKTISFDEGEFFILHNQSSVRQRNWWQVVSMKGNIGFVPSNYVTNLKVEPDFLIGFLDSCIESLKLSKDEDINGIITRTELIEKLKERKRNVELTLKKKIQTNAKRPKNPTDASSDSGGSSQNNSSNHQNNHHQQRANGDAFQGVAVASKPNEKMTKKSLSSSAVSQVQPPQSQPMQESSSMQVLTAKLDDISMSSEVSLSDPTHTTTSGDTSSEITTISRHDDSKRISTRISPANGQQSHSGVNATITASESGTVKQQQQQTQQQHVTSNGGRGEKSMDFQVASETVYQIVDAVRQNTNLSHELSCVALRTILSEMEMIMPRRALPYLEGIAVHLGSPLLAPDNLLGETNDARRLRAIFADLADCKNDSEQRTWMLYEDEDDIVQYIQELTGILRNADPRICCHEMSCDHYQSIINLVQYYQMETRWSIRKLLLQSFKAMCHLDHVAVDILLGSVLPAELVQDMYSNSANVERLRELAGMLTMIFSLGLKMPVTHEEQLDSEFVRLMLRIIETPPTTDLTEVLPEVMITLLLSYNLQFDTVENCVLDAFLSVVAAKTTTEKLLMMINREDDPTVVLKHERANKTNSVLKLVTDLFDHRDTASLFYTSDCKVLIDILVRQLSDLSPGDENRRKYLELCRRILRNTDYAEHTHRKQDLMKIFTRIFCEETEESVNDQKLVREIANEFPQIFKA